MFSHCRYTVICFVILFLHLPKSEANDEAIQLGLRQVDLSGDLNGWVPVTQSKQINYGEWITTGGNNGGGVPNGWGGIWEQTTTLVWEDFKTVTSNKFERAVLSDGENGLRVRSIDPFVPSKATRYTQQVINSYIVSPRIDLSKIEIPKVFKILRQYGQLDTADMLRTFNMGVGLAIITPPKNVKFIKNHLQTTGYHSYVIGEIGEGKKQVHFTNKLQF